MDMLSEDHAVSATNDDATVCKHAAIQKGYWKDPFISAFYKSRRSSKKPPIINRGYYARTKAMEVCTSWFLKSVGSQAQIVNLGAGFDTLFWKLRANGDVVNGFYEVDSESVVLKKRHIIAKDPLLAFANTPTPPPTTTTSSSSSSNNIIINNNNNDSNTDDDDDNSNNKDNDNHSSSATSSTTTPPQEKYELIDADLRYPDTVMKKLIAAGIDVSRPTLFIAECVLVYFSAEDSTNLLTTLANHFSTAVVVNYEMINPQDPFGQVMVRNLEMRGCPLRGLDGCPDLVAQRARFTKAGWKAREPLDMNAVYNLLPCQDVARIQKLEIFDEVEEWQLISSHYCVSTAYRDIAGIFDFDDFPL